MPSLQYKPLRYCGDDDEYRLYRAGLEWSLDDPIVIEDREDLKSEKRWRDTVQPYEHQVTNLITFCRRLPVTLLADDVGLGKTISAGLIASELISRGRVSRILVVCPKLLIPQWREELRTKFDIRSEKAIGRDLIRLKPSWDVGAIVTTYNTARLYLEEIERDRFDMLVLDEAHKLRNLYGVDPPPQVAKRFRNALADRLFRYVLMLTATPIQNRLWDLYSLVDLLTVARGHENPFGSEGMFIRKFIADNATQARQLKMSAKDEFRAIVYGYMSRVRRGDANLKFPDRVVQMHTVPPTVDELRLIETIAEPIARLNRLAQISILQALTSSPHALTSQLDRMAMKGTFPAPAAAAVRDIVANMGMSAKLLGLSALVDELQAEHHERWRMVVFTGRRETQTTIQAFLEQRGIRVGIINGSSGERNQDTIERFWTNPPDCHVIVSTEAGAEGVNLQVANVLVNYDLPWNPMTVEQRIGRIQRLASQHANVCIYNITLAGTFEQYIVGRLMEKLQMASHAIGDVEALLEASGIEDGEEGNTGFEEKIRALVLASLAGVDVKAATEMQVKSIEQAKVKLEKEEKNINDLLGGMDGSGYQGPRTPTLPAVERSMDVESFTFAALAKLGSKVTVRSPGVYLAERGNSYEIIKFNSKTHAPASAVLYAEGSSAFERLVRSIIDKGMQRIADVDEDASGGTRRQVERWAQSFGGNLASHAITGVERRFSGKAIVRVRATVAHDSYERLVEVDCVSGPSAAFEGTRGLDPLPASLGDLGQLGMNPNAVVESARNDQAIVEFCRFYEERRTQETTAAGGDARKRQKLEDEFTPRLEMALVGLEGALHRRVAVRAHYRVNGELHEYTSAFKVVPSAAQLEDLPVLERCEKSGREVPVDCLDRCAISGSQVLRHLLVKSQLSGRLALPENTVQCSVSGKTILSDEAERSDVSSQLVARDLLKISPVSGKKGEAGHFSACAFTGVEVLLGELAVSEISGKRYRSDQQAESSISGTRGHRSEFVSCAQTLALLAPAEAQRCEISGQYFAPGILERCAATNKLVHPGELDTCSVAGARMLRSLLKTSALSGRKAEARHFAHCGFTGSEVLESELATSEICGKRYRKDEACVSSVSGRTGHGSEFVTCWETHLPIASDEAERCEITGRQVRPGILQRCVVTQKLVHPSELERSALSGKKALRSLFVTSSVSGVRLLEEEAVSSLSGSFCAPYETRKCEWSGKRFHPDDIRVCELSGVAHHVQYATGFLERRLQPLQQLLNGISHRADASHIWDAVAGRARDVMGGGRCHVEAAELSPDGHHLAATVEVRKLLGLRVQHAGLLYSVSDEVIVGRVAVGQRSGKGWSAVS